jgi:hypothetical protein
MATIKLCDWTKERLKKGEETFVVAIGDQEFEVGVKGRNLLLKQLEGDEELESTQPEPVVPAKPKEPAPPPLQAAQPGGVQIEVQGSPFEPGPSSMPIAPQAEAAPQQPSQESQEQTQQPVNPDEMLEIPEDPRRAFKKPSAKLAQRIVDEATVFDEGTLPSLTMGGAKHREAMKRLKDLEEQANAKVARKAQKGVRIHFDNEGPMGRY